MSSSRFDRRTLLKATAAAAPYVITSAALGNADTPPASQRVTLGHIGVGNEGGFLLSEKAFQRCRGFQSLAVVDAYQDRRERYAHLIKGTAYGDFRELLDRRDVDAVVIATPDHWHVPIAMAAVRAKKDAYVEKPLGLSIEQDLACLKAFAESGRIFQYGTQQRSMSHCRFGCELVRSGRIGKVHTIEVVAPNGGAGGSTVAATVPRSLDYNMWCGPAPLRPYTPDRCRPSGTYWIYDYAIGYLAGWGAHPLDIMIWGSDADLASPITVEGTGVIPATGLYDTVYNWDMKIQLGDGVQMTFKPGRRGEDSTKFIGPDGWVRIARNGLDAQPKSLPGSKIGPHDVHLFDSPNHYQNFIDAVKSRRPPVSPLDQAVRSDTISHLCNIAVRTRRQITWDPKTATIVGDDEARKLMHRDMRPPWTL
jgi:glucose-fructose oxidoreductase